MLNHLRRKIVTMAFKGGEGHIPSALSILDIVYTYYTKIHNENTRFILSKGHGCLALYVVLAEVGLMPKELLECYPNPPLQGHPDRNLEIGIEATTGSLGHGLPMAVGMAMAMPEKDIFVLVGDGECQEGATWEAIQVISRLNLDNLHITVDLNGSSALSKYAIQCLFRGCASIYNTVKGYGIKRMEQDPDKWHHRIPTLDEYCEIMEELDEKADG